MLKPELKIFFHIVILSITSISLVCNDGTLSTKNTSKSSDILRSKRMEPSKSFDTVKEKEIEGWEQVVDRDPKKYFERFKDSTIIPGRELCKPNTEVVIIIPSHPGNVNERAAIRGTWASARFKGVKVGFLVGYTGSPYVESMIDQESVLYKDIIEERFTDTVKNLTLKSILLLKWFLRHCPTQKFLVKADEDTYIDVPLLARDLAILPRSGVLQGFQPTEKLANSYATSKRYCPKCQAHLEHLSGAGYFMSRDVVAKLYNASLDTPIVHLEDIYITGICAEKAGVEPQVYAGSKQVRTVLGDRDCHVFNRMCHTIQPERMQHLWERLQNEKALLRQNP